MRGDEDTGQLEAKGGRIYRSAFLNLHETILSARRQAEALPKSRESALVLTKIDEARLWLGEVLS